MFDIANYPPAEPFESEEALRQAAVELARYACNGDEGRVLGDPVFEEVTEGRAHYPRYSACGDLAQWVLMRLGLRDERILNRSDDGGKVPWSIGQNLSKIVYKSGKAFVWASASKRPKPGDILYVAMPEHVCVLDELKESEGKIITCDYGLWNASQSKPAGKRCHLPLRVQGKKLLVGNRILRGWLNIAALPGLVAAS